MHFAIIRGSPAEPVLAELREYSNREENILDTTQPRTQQKLAGILDGKEHSRVVPLADPSGVTVEYYICFTVDRIKALSQSADDPTTPMTEIQVDLRHLTVATAFGFPTPTAMIAIAYFFGFKGAPDDWTFNPHPNEENAMAIVQVINEEQVGKHRIIMTKPPKPQEARQ